MDPSIEICEDNNDPNTLPSSANFTIEDQSLKESHIERSFTTLSNNFCFVSTLREFEDLLRKHEIETCSKYTIYKTNGLFKGNGKDLVRKPRVHWGVLGRVSASLALTPYLIVGSRYYVCHLGKCYYAARLQKNRKELNSSSKKYNKATESKKIGCPATFKVQRLVVFPDNKVSSDNPSEKARAGLYIRKNISSLHIEHVYLFKFPNACDHEKHEEGGRFSDREPLDKRIVEKIQELVTEGITDTSQIGYLLKQYIEKEIQVRNTKRRRFCPSSSDIQRFISITQKKIRNSKINRDELNVSFVNSLGGDNEVLLKLCSSDYSKNHGDGRFFYNQSNDRNSSSFVFVFQNTEMKRLFNHYGLSCFLLDPTYRFCKFPIPFYSVVVQTNVSFQTVAIIILEIEKRDSIIEALEVLKKWNLDVLPKYILVDNNIEEIAAVENAFPQSRVFIPSFYVTEAWCNRLLFSHFLDVDHSDVLLKINAIIEATSEDALRSAVTELKLCNRVNKEYFEKTWQREIKRWVSLYKPSDMLFETNEAVDRLGEELRYASLQRVKRLSLSQFIKYLCLEFIPETLSCYSVLNQKLSCSNSSIKSYIPFYLLNRPQWIIDVVMEKIRLTEQCLPYSFVEPLEETVFSVHIKNEEKGKFLVKFDGSQKVATCNCSFYTKRKFICEHAIIVGRFYPAWNMDKISTWLFNYPIFKRDPGCTESYYDVNDVNGSSSIPNERYNLSDTSKEERNVLPNSVEQKDESEQFSIVDECLQYLVSFERMAEAMVPPQLSTFRDDLRDLHSRWTQSLQETETSDSEELPIPYLRSVTRFFANNKEPRSSNKHDKKSSSRSLEEN